MIELNRLCCSYSQQMTSRETLQENGSKAYYLYNKNKCIGQDNKLWGLEGNSDLIACSQAHFILDISFYKDPATRL